MNLIEKQVSTTVGIIVLHGIRKGVRRKPEIVQRGVEYFRCVGEGLLDVLEHQRGFACSFWAFDANKVVPPVDVLIQVSLEGGEDGR